MGFMIDANYGVGVSCSKDQLLASLKAGAVNVIALHLLTKGQIEKDLFTEVMDDFMSGRSWLGLVVGEEKVIFYRGPVNGLARNYQDLADKLDHADGYHVLSIQELKSLVIPIKEAQELILERRTMLLFDFEQYPGGSEMMSFFLVPIDGFTARIPGLVGGNA